MKHRLFIAINLANDAKKALSNYQWPELPARWTKTENLHITLLFIGDTEEKRVEEIRQILKSVKQEPFSIILNKISYSPHKKEEAPRMVWAIGEKTREFVSLSDNLGKMLKIFNKESIPHITLARIKEWEWKRIEPDERPEIEEYINIEIPVDSIELMESVLKRGGPEYTILESYKL